MATSECRTVVPTIISSIGTFGGTVMLAPADARATPAGVSRHCSPASMYHAVGFRRRKLERPDDGDALASLEIHLLGTEIR